MSHEGGKAAESRDCATGDVSSNYDSIPRNKTILRARMDQSRRSESEHSPMRGKTQLGSFLLQQLSETADASQRARGKRSNSEH